MVTWYVESTAKVTDFRLEHKHVERFLCRQSSLESPLELFPLRVIKMHDICGVFNKINPIFSCILPHFSVHLYTKL